MSRRSMAVYTHVGDWWAASIEGIPGCHSQDRTLDEARENLRDALEGMLEVFPESIEASPAEVVREPPVLVAS